MNEIIYILINEAMTGLVKIGITKNLEKRIKSLDTTGVPLPFRCYYAAEVYQANLLEKKLHQVFIDRRVRSRREFFRVEPYQVRVAISIASAQFIQEVTPKEDIFSEASDGPALERIMRLNDKKLHLKIRDLEIPVGTILQFVGNKSIVCEVVSDYKVDYEGEIMSLSRAALEAYKKLGYKWSVADRLESWMYEGETLSYRKMLREQEDEEKEEVIEADSNQTIAKIRDKMIEALNRKYKLTLSRRTIAEYIDERTGTAVRLMVSNKYDKTTHDYWYTLYTQQITYLKSVKRGYVCFGFMDKDIICLVPIADIEPLLKYCGVTEKRNSYHFYIKSGHDGKLTFYFPNDVPEHDLSRYVITLD